jgi:hypothetical protein
MGTNGQTERGLYTRTEQCNRQHEPPTTNHAFAPLAAAHAAGIGSLLSFLLLLSLQAGAATVAAAAALAEATATAAAGRQEGVATAQVGRARRVGRGTAARRVAA